MNGAEHKVTEQEKLIETAALKTEQSINRGPLTR